MLKRYRLLGFIKKLIGRWRIALGFCPMCNSDAPEVYSCPLCHGYQQASGNIFPPSKYTTEVWRIEFDRVVDSLMFTKDAVYKSRKKR